MNGLLSLLNKFLLSTYFESGIILSTEAITKNIKELELCSELCTLVGQARKHYSYSSNVLKFSNKTACHQFFWDQAETEVSWHVIILKPDETQESRVTADISLHEAEVTGVISP